MGKRSSTQRVGLADVNQFLKYRGVLPTSRLAAPRTTEVNAISYKRKPPINWMGNKTCLLEQILPLLPDPLPCFCEVFGGSGALTFSVPVLGSEKEIYNDFNRDLVNFMLVIRYRPHAFLYELSNHCINASVEFYAGRHALHPEDIRTEQERKDAERYRKAVLERAYETEEAELGKGALAEEEYQALKKELGNKADLFDVHRAVVFYKIQRLSYGGGGRNYGGVFRDLRGYTKDILWGSHRLARVVIQNKDFEALIRQYDAPDMFFFCDPPYHTTEGVYDVEFPISDHTRLRDTLLGIQGKCMVTYNDDEFIRDLYSDPVFHILPVERPNSLSSKKDAIFKEVIITNYDTARIGGPEQLTLL